MSHTRKTYTGAAGGASRFGWINHAETYGPQVIRRFLQSIHPHASILDLGAGGGRDLGIARDVLPEAKTYAVECSSHNVELLKAAGHQCSMVNLEKNMLPFDDSSLDVIIANQVLEHVKELFWIAHEVSRTLRVGGHFIVGVPNVAAFHNRILLLLGKHPSQLKACSAHIRAFSKGDFQLFLEECFPGGYSLEQFSGSQFYPFPTKISQFLSRTFPQCAHTIFFLFKKEKKYEGSFLRYPVEACLETNFYLG